MNSLTGEEPAGLVKVTLKNPTEEINRDVPFVMQRIYAEDYKNYPNLPVKEVSLGICCKVCYLERNEGQCMHSQTFETTLTFSELCHALKIR